MIRFESVTHRFGPRAVLRSVSFHVPRGQVCGFVGPNGAGKTTAMRLLVTLLPVQEGRVSVGGIDVDEDPLEVRRLVGFMPDAFGVYERVTIEEYLEFFAASFGITAAGRGRKVSEVMDLARIGGLRDRMVSELSKGMRQRLALARTMLHDPALLVLDEPANGLDPRARLEMRDLILELQRIGKTIFLSSHILTELADIVSSVVVLERGVIQCSGALADVAARAGNERTVVVRLLRAPDAPDRALADLVGVRSVELRGDRALAISLDGGDDLVAGVVERLVHAGYGVVSVEPERSDLERVFLRMTQGELQ
ncbi:MAG: ABC transporter ATP-binding protein [Deltaproteobacteria bacterium]|nr:ABC transporter ATP-binding protein [Deltaproteobacteria bacterium]